MHQEDDEYEGEIPHESYCMMCGTEEHCVHASDRWNFQVDNDNFWLCRVCHGRFENIEEFNAFRQRFSDVCMYRSAAGIQSMLLHSAPASVLALFIKAIIARALTDERLAPHMRKELKKITSNAVLMEGENPCS